MEMPALCVPGRRGKRTVLGVDRDRGWQCPLTGGVTLEGRSVALIV